MMHIMLCCFFVHFHIDLKNQTELIARIIKIRLFFNIIYRIMWFNELKDIMENINLNNYILYF